MYMCYAIYLYTLCIHYMFYRYVINVYVNAYGIFINLYSIVSIIIALYEFAIKKLDLNRMLPQTLIFRPPSLASTHLAAAH